MELTRISKYAGMREDLVQAGGGNSSVKISANEMLIKASGCQLSEVDDTNGYTKVNYRKVADFMEKNLHVTLSDEMGKKALSDAILEGKRPSIETFLHSITGRVTLHTHPVLVNALTARKGGMEVLSKLFPEALLVDYATPGVLLAQKYFSQYQQRKNAENREFDVIFLKNHGLIVSADTADAVIQKTDDVIQKIVDFLGVSNTAYTDATILHQLLSKWGIIEKDKIVYLSVVQPIYEAYRMFHKEWKHCFCPDCLVYCNKKMMTMDSATTIDQAQGFLEAYGRPVVVFFNDHVYIVADNVKKAKEIESVVSFSAQVAMLNKDHTMDLLSDEEQNYLLNWESEKYRKNMK